MFARGTSRLPATRIHRRAGSGTTWRRGSRLACLAVAALIGVGASTSPFAGASSRVPVKTGHVFRLIGNGPPRAPWDRPSRNVCGSVGAGQARCLAQVLAASTRGAAAKTAAASTTPAGLSPANLDAVYGFPTSQSVGTGTIALVDAYNDPDIGGDLASFDSEYGLPTPNFNEAYIEANAAGQPVVETTPPKLNTSWDLEISLDVEWAHAVAPAAPILLVEAYSGSFADLLAAEQYAGANATYVSNSWGGTEFSGESAYDSSFLDSGVSYFAASGDSGGVVMYPSASPDVISVGGTSLLFNSEGLASETAWSDGGGGCSTYENSNPAQSTGSVSCAGKRATPDISSDADPQSGLAVYDSIPYDNGTPGWLTVGGTSASTVEIAAESDAAGLVMTASSVYNKGIPIRDVVSGSNGYPALVGYDLATGVGSWSNTPGSVTTLSATGASNGVTLKWTPPTGGASVSSYNIFRGTSSGGESLLTSGVTATGYTDSTADPGTAYYYEVQPVNGLGVGPLSNETEATAATVSQGNLSGTVTAASSGNPIGNICVYLYQPGNSAAASYGTCTLTNGTYEFYGVASGSYDVGFADPAGAYVTQWYNATSTGAPTQSGAKAVTVPTGNQTIAAINAAMALVHP